MTIKIIFGLVCILVTSLHASVQNSIENARKKSDPVLLASLLKNTVLLEQEKLYFQRMAREIIKTKEKQFKQAVMNFKAFKSHMSGSLCALAIIVGAASIKRSTARASFAPVLTYGLTFVPLVGIMYKLHVLGKKEEDTYRMALCDQYNTAIEKALQVNLLMHDWNYNKEGILTGPFLPFQV